MRVGEAEKGVRAAAYGWRFGGVALDPTTRRVWIDGVETTVSPLPFGLLALLCDAGGRQVPRDAVFAALWPRQEVSDDSLTTLVSRTRELLGPYGSALVTVRDQGFRLDLPITARDADDEAATTLILRTDGGRDPDPDRTAPMAVAPPPDPVRPAAPDRSVFAADPARPRAGGRLGRAIALAALAVVLALTFGIVADRARNDAAGDGDPVAFRGYALRISDVGASRPETIELLRLAEAAWDTGDIERARTLLRAAAEGDLATPVPRLLLAVLSLTGDDADARRELADARARLGPDSSAYLRVLAAYVEAAVERRDRGRAAADAVLSLRPEAWRLQLRRAHMDLAQRNLAAALAALRAIPVDGPPASVVEMVLGDRASLGDADAVAALLDQGVLRDSPLARAGVEARLAWSRGDTTAALAAYDHQARLAREARAYSDAASADEAGAVIAFGAGLVDAEARLHAARQAILDEGQLQQISQLAALAAELALERGDAAEAARLLEDAARRRPIDPVRLSHEIHNAQLGFPVPAGTFFPDPAAAAAWPSGEASLLTAWQAYARGDRDAARRDLEAARTAGIGASWQAEQAALLATRLGLEAPLPCRVDPPYPNLLRFSACRALSRLAAPARSGESGEGL